LHQLGDLLELYVKLLYQKLSTLNSASFLTTRNKFKVSAADLFSW